LLLFVQKKQTSFLKKRSKKLLYVGLPAGVGRRRREFISLASTFYGGPNRSTTNNELEISPAG